MRTHWEKLTQGLCNAALPDKPKPKPLTVADMKRIARKAKPRAELHFNKCKALNTEGAEGRKAKKKLSESWLNRGGQNITGFYKPKTAKAVAKGKE